MKQYTVKNKDFQFSVKEVGAELCSLKSEKTGVEYIWNANPDIWASHAPNLFPIIGCLKEDAFLYKGKAYSCPKHGFIRRNEKIILLKKTANSLTFGLKYDDELLKIYPFKFEFQIKYTLNENKLEVAHKIINHGDEPMFFSLGGHPGFTCPFNEGENYSDYFLEFEYSETAETWRVLENGLIGAETSPIFDTPTVINLHPQLFKEDALVFKNLNSSVVSLKSKKSHQVLSMEFKDFPYLGIWAKPNAPYVCIEPWIGIADSFDSNRKFKDKEGLVSLEANKEFEASYLITIIE